MRVDVWTLAIRGRGDSCDLEARNDGLANVLLTPSGGRAGIGSGAVAILPRQPSAESVVEQTSIFSLVEPLASPSPSPDSERDWLIRVATSRLPFLPLLTSIAPSGWSGRTSPAFCHPTKDGTLVPSSEGWGSSGMGGPTESWTLNISDWPSDGSACSLSQILEAGSVPRRFYLSARACRGILRRAEKRGKALPTALRTALEGVAAQATAPTATTTSAESTPSTTRTE